MASEEIGALVVKVGLDGTGFQEGVGGINRQMKIVQAEFQAASAKLGQFGDSTEQLKLKADSLNKQMELQKQKVAALQTAYEKSAATKGEDAKATQDLQLKLLRAQTAMSNIDNQITRTNEEIKQQEKAFEADAKSSEGSFTKMKTAASGFHDHLSTAFGAVKTAVLGLGATLVGGGGMFEFVDKAVELGDATYELSKKMGITTQEAGNLNKILKVTDTSADAVTGTMMRLDKGVESAGAKGNATTKALAEFGVKLTDAHGKLLPMTDQLAALSEGYEKAAASGNEEAYSAQVLGNRGKELIPMLADYKEAQEAASKVKGIVPIDPVVAHKMKEDLAALKLQFGQFGMSIASAFLPVSQALLPELMTTFQQLAAGIAAHKAEITGAINNIVGVVKDIGTIAIPIVKDLLTFIADHGKATEAAIVAIGVAFGAWKIGNVIKDVMAGMKAMGILTVAENGAMGLSFGAVGTAASAAWTAITGPVGLVVLGIAAVAGAAFLIVKNWSSISNFFKGLWADITGTVSTAWNAIKSLFNGQSITQTISNIWNGIKTTTEAVWNGIKTFFVGFWNGIVAGVMAIATPFVTGIINLFNGMKTGLTTIMEGYKNYLTGIWEVIKNIFLGAILLIIDLVTGNFTQLKEDATKIFNNLKDALGQIWTGIKQIFTGSLQALSGFLTTEWNGIKSTAETVWNGVKSFFSGLWDGIKSTASSAWNGFKSWLSGFWDGIVQGAKDIWNGLLNWFRTLPDSLHTIAVNMFNSMKNGVTSTVTGVKTAVVTGITSAITWIKGLPSQALQWGKDMIQGLINGIKSMVSSIGNAVSNVASTIRSFLHFSTPDQGPLADYESWMPDFMAGMASGIEKSKSVLKSSINGLAADMSLGVKQSINVTSQDVSRASAVNSQGNGQAISFADMFRGANFYVRSDNDVYQLSTELSQQTAYRLQAAGAGRGR